METQKIKLTSEAVLGGVRVPEGAVVELQGNALFYAGQKLELGLTTADVHDPTELPTYLAGFSNEEFRNGEISQIILVDKDEDKYRTFNSNAAFQPVTVKTDDDAGINEVKVETSLTNYKVQPRRLGAFIPDTVASQANPNYNVRYVHMERCARAINMDLELDVIGPSGLLTQTANWSAGYFAALAAGFQWGGPSGPSSVGVNSNPIADLRARQNKTLQRITSHWANPRVMGVFLDHPAVRDYFRFMMGDNALNGTIKAVAGADGGNEDFVDFMIVGLGKFRVVSAKYAASLTADPDFIMPDVFLSIVQPPGVPTNGERIATSYNFRRRGPAGNGFNTREVRIEQRGAGGTLVIAEEASIPTMTSSKCGGLITGVYA